MDVEQARSIGGSDKLIGVSTHNLEQFERAAACSADYIAIGPVFSTTSKGNPDPVVGVDFIRKVRACTDKLIVAIGGITVERAAAVIEAGADSIAVISGVLSAPNPPQRARQYLETLQAAKHAAAV
jgi:thiamine-phosphate pyrophosphorylase